MSHLSVNHSTVQKVQDVCAFTYQPVGKYIIIVSFLSQFFSECTIGNVRHRLRGLPFSTYAPRGWGVGGGR